MIDAECAICYDTLHGNDSVRVLQCNHSYHEKCISSWVSSGYPLAGECPFRCGVNPGDNPVTPPHSTRWRRIHIIAVVATWVILIAAFAYSLAASVLLTHH